MTTLGAWQAVLDGTRTTNGTPRGRYDLRPYWRAQAFAQYAEQPEPIVRAHALAQVLDSASLHRYPGERMAGSLAGFYTDTLPDAISEDAYVQALAAHDARGQRWFWTNWDHSVADYRTLMAIGIGGYLARAHAALQTHTAPSETAFLQGVIITLEALSRYALRQADAARQAGGEELAAVLAHIALAPPTTLHEALQLTWLVLMAFVSEGRYAMALGRLDQYTYAFYEQDVAAGRITRAEALDLLCHLWAKVEELGEVTNICIGGLTPEGDDATNEMSYLCLEATARVLSPHTNLSARFHDGSPERFHRACFETIRTGVGFPAIFNDHVLLPGLEEIGIPPEVARDYCMVGCIETMLSGRQQAWSDCSFNTPQCLERALRRLQTEPVRSYARLVELFQDDMRATLAAHLAKVDEQAVSCPPERFPDPFLSALTRDCIGRARDINDGGAEYQRFFGVAIMGVATLADSFAAVKRLVFEEGAVEYERLMAALESDFAHDDALRLLLLNRPPKYGNDDPYVDEIAAWVVSWCADEVLRHHVRGGGRYVAAFGSNVWNIAAGKEVGATPDGRRAGTPLSDAASPHFGRDLHGPTAVLQSVSRPDYHRVLTGSVINMKFEPEYFQGDEGAQRFAAFTHFFVQQRIPELQFNFTGNELLLAAQQHPEHYPHLVVRVSGFSAYFNRLTPEVQHDIIRRRAHV